MKRDAQDIAALAKLLDAALALPSGQRATWIEQLDEAQEIYKPALRKLLDGEQANSDFTFSDGSRKVHAAMNDAASRTESIKIEAGARVGPYELVRELGRGGMSTVWLARRIEGLTRRMVALKLPHPGILHAEFAARMVRERDILESLAHPNIARLYDAGVTSAGQPYLALEYVEGLPLNEYCDSKQLGVRERMQLFGQVLRALQHAHSHLVIHRDLKPANILVTNEGVAMVLDFGIAKLLAADGATADTALTQFGGRALTPDYASPEQIAGAPLTTASDVYSLGVILHELLTGEKPYNLARGSAAELEEAILRADVRRPSQTVGDEARAAARGSSAGKLARTLRGDLDTIVLTALRVKLAERYLSADALAVDVANYLDGRAINARPESWWEASHRFVGRHKLAVASSSIVVLALAAGVAVATWQAAKARASEQRALAAAETSDAVKEFMIRIFRTNTLNQAEAAKAREMNALQLLENAGNQLATQFDDKPKVHTELLDVITRLLGESRSGDYEKHALELIALLEKQPGTELKQGEMYVELSLLKGGNDWDESIRLAEKGKQVIAHSTGPLARKTRAQLLFAEAQPFGSQGKIEESRKMLDEAESLLSDGFKNTAEYGHVLADKGWLQMRAENYPAALDFFERAMVAYQADPTAYKRTLAQGHAQLAIGYMLMKDYKRAERESIESGELFKTDYGPEDAETALSFARAGKFILMQNRYDDAIAMIKPTIVVLDKPSANPAPDYVRSAHEYLADALVSSGRLQEAAEPVRLAVDLASKMNPAAQLVPLSVAADYEAALGHTERAEDYSRKAVDGATQAYANSPKKIYRVLNRRGQMLITLGKIDEADALFRDNIDKDSAEAGDVTSMWTMASVQHARVLTMRGKAADALPLLETTLKSHLTQPASRQDLNDEYEYRSTLAAALLALNRPTDALPHFQRVLELRSSQFKYSPRLAEAQIALANCDLALGDVAGARALYAKAKAIHAANPELSAYYRKPLAALAAALAKAPA